MTPRRLACALLAGALAGCSSSAPDDAGPPAPSASGVAGAAWTAGPAAPVERTEVGAGVAGGAVWVLGGFTPSGAASADVVRFDPPSGAWSAGPAMPQALHHTSVAGDGNRLWVAGGYTSHHLSDPTAAVRVLDAATGVWSDGPTLPSPRAAGALAFDGSRLVYGGGVGPSGLAGDVFALEDGAWRRLGALSPAREHLAAASDGRGTTWFLAGREGGLDSNLPDVDVVSGATVREAGRLPTPRGGVAGLHVPGAGACAVGGESPAGTFTEVECLSADGRATSLPPLPEGRHGLGAVVAGSTAFALLGGPQPGLTVSSTVQRLELTPAG